MQELIRRKNAAGGVVILTLMLDSLTVHENKELMEYFLSFLEKDGKKTVLDLSNTSYVASMVISSLVFLHKRVSTQGGEVVLCSVNSRIKEILASMKLDKIFNVFDDLDQALGYLNGSSKDVPKQKKEAKMKLNVKGFALAGGILWGASVFLVTWMKILGYGSSLDVIKSYYIGYSVTPLGSVIGGVYGFFDMGIACLLFALLYNALSKE